MPHYDSKTALLVVDFQNDFADSKGSLSVSGAQELIDQINGEIGRALEAGALVVYTQDWHPEVTPHFSKYGGRWPVHCVAGTWGAELHPLLAVHGDVVQKGTGGEDGYSGFAVKDPTSGLTAPTGLQELLAAKGIERTVVVGLTTDYCVKETAMDAVRLGYEVTVLEDAVRAVDLEPGDGERALEAVRDAGGQVESGKRRMR